MKWVDNRMVDFRHGWMFPICNQDEHLYLYFDIGAGSIVWPKTHLRGTRIDSSNRCWACIESLIFSTYAIPHVASVAITLNQENLKIYIYIELIDGRIRHHHHHHHQCHNHINLRLAASNYSQNSKNQTCNLNHINNNSPAGSEGQSLLHLAAQGGERCEEARFCFLKKGSWWVVLHMVITYAMIGVWIL